MSRHPLQTIANITTQSPSGTPFGTLVPALRRFRGSSAFALALAFVVGLGSMLVSSPSARAQDAPMPAADPAAAAMVNAVGYLRSQQEADGSFGQPQAHLRTGFVMLAVLSRRAVPDPIDLDLLERATRYLLASSGSTGDLSDPEFETESHAVALAALIACHEHLRDPQLRTETAERIGRALKQLIRWQDRSSSSDSRGGWKMEGSKGRVNDRRATGWALFALATARAYGLEVPDANIERAAHFMLAAAKTDTAAAGDQLGGFSVDTEGLTVDLISGMGGWSLAMFQGPATLRRQNLAWLAARSPAWSGPNWFYSNFFRVRVLKGTASMDPALYGETMRRLQAQVRDHQSANGSVQFPPGNAQNTIAMGPVFSTAMAILIVGIDDSRLPMDEDYAPVSRLPAVR